MKNQTNLLFFHIEDCHWCAWAKENVLNWMATDTDSYGAVNIIKVDAYNFYDIIDYELGMTGDELADELNVHLFPTIVITKGNDEIGRIVGVALKDEYWHSIDQLLKGVT